MWQWRGNSHILTIHKRHESISTNRSTSKIRQSCMHWDQVNAPSIAILHARPVVTARLGIEVAQSVK